MASEEMPLLQEDSGKKRAIKAAGKSLKLLLNVATGSIGGDVAEIVYEYTSDYLRERNNRRTDELKARLDAAPKKVQEVLESSEHFEPLVDVFLSVYRMCLADDEDAKVPYYAALMMGFASPDTPALTAPQKMALLQSVKNLRAHDFWVLEVIHRTKSPYPNGPCIMEMQKQSKGPTAAPVYRKVDWDLLPQGLRSLISVGLVNDDPRQETGAVPQANRFQLTKLGKLLWQKCIENLPNGQ